MDWDFANNFSEPVRDHTGRFKSTNPNGSRFEELDRFLESYGPTEQPLIRAQLVDELVRTASRNAITAAIDRVKNAK